MKSEGAASSTLICSASLSRGIARNSASCSGTILMSTSIVRDRHPRSTAVAPPVKYTRAGSADASPSSRMKRRMRSASASARMPRLARSSRVAESGCCIGCARLRGSRARAADRAGARVTRRAPEYAGRGGEGGERRPTRAAPGRFPRRARDRRAPGGSNPHPATHHRPRVDDTAAHRVGPRFCAQRSPGSAAGAHDSSGLTIFRTGNRAKSRSVVASVAPCSIASAARCAWLASGPTAWPSTSACRSTSQ